MFKDHFGFSVIEMLIVMALTVIAATFAYSIFFETNRLQALDKDTVKIISLLERARSLTLSSKGDAQYGVHFESSRAVLFKGLAYSSSDSGNLPENLTSLSNISLWTLQGFGDNIIFDRLTGKTSQYGTIEISLVSDSAVKKTITVHSTGLIESQ
jgi:prepilin-type N-terminal cleavage/methylation domain-containing protein